MVLSEVCPYAKKGYHSPQYYFVGDVYAASMVRHGGAPISKDAGEYYRLAMHIKAGEGFCARPGVPTAYRPPAYPAALALVLHASGDRLTAVKVGEAVLDTATCGLLFAVAFVLIGPVQALVCAGLWAINPLAFDSGYAPGR